MFQALLSTITELLDSKKAAYSFIATILACVLHLYFGVDVTNALLLVSPLGVATASQAHVDASAAKSKSASVAAAATPAPAPAVPVVVAEGGDTAKVDG
jgi:hypothetical protein